MNFCDWSILPSALLLCVHTCESVDFTVVPHAFDFVHARTLADEVSLCLSVCSKGRTWCECAVPQTCRHWHGGLLTAQRPGDRCCRGNGAAASWAFQANKRAPSSDYLLLLPFPHLRANTPLPDIWQQKCKLWRDPIFNHTTKSHRLTVWQELMRKFSHLKSIQLMRILRNIFSSYNSKRY